MRIQSVVLRGTLACIATLAATWPSLAATDVLDRSNFDRSISPKSDFYRFAVGGWRAKHPIPGDRTSWSAFDEVEKRNESRTQRIMASADQTGAPAGSERRKVGDFYAACMDVAEIERRGIAPIRARLQRVGAMAGVDLPAAFAAVSADDPAFAPGFAFGSEQDPGSATRVIASVGQGGLSLPTRDYYLTSDARSVAIRHAFVREMATMFALVGDGPVRARGEATAVLVLETKLARVSKAPDALRDPFANYHPMTLASLRTLAPAFDWSRYFEATGLERAELGRIDVGQPAFARGFGRLARSEPHGSWESYLRWRTLAGTGSALPRAFRDAAFAFRQTVFGVRTQPTRMRTCTSATDEALGFAVGKIYVGDYFPPSARARARAEISAIRASLRSDIATVAWMGPQTRAAALRKLSKLSTVKVGYPDRWRDYSKLTVTRSDYLDDVARGHGVAFARDVTKIGKPVDRTEWGLTPQTVNAYYDPSMNEIVIPAGILEKPFFDASADDAVNFGGIGVVIGHEMTHGYDDEGSDFDGDGNLRTIVTKSDAARFHARVRCIVDQLDAYKTDVGIHLNGKLDAGEAAADLGGLKLSFRAMQAAFAKDGHPAPLGGFTAEQRYFLSFAQVWRENVRPEVERADVLGDPHPVGRYRANGTTADSDAFVRAFDVAPGDAMYRSPARRCAIW